MQPAVTRRALLGATAVVASVSALPALASPAAAVHPDAGLFALLESLPGLIARRDDLERRQDALWERMADVEPAPPDALRVRALDHFNVSAAERRAPDGRWVWFYEPEAADELRALPEAVFKVDERRDGAWIMVPDEGRVERRAEILAALDGWRSDVEAVRDRLGIPAADAAALAANGAVQEAWAAILSTSPLTLAGLVAKARWATSPDAPTGWAERWRASVAADLVALADRAGAGT